MPPTNDDDGNPFAGKIELAGGESRERQALQMREWKESETRQSEVVGSTSSEVNKKFSKKIQNQRTFQRTLLGTPFSSELSSELSSEVASEVASELNSFLEFLACGSWAAS